MTDLTKDALGSILVIGYFVDDTVSFLGTGKLAGGETRHAYREMHESSLDLQFYSAEDEDGKESIVIAGRNFAVNKFSVPDIDHVRACLNNAALNRLYR